MQFLNGKKTYITAIALAVTAVAGFINGELSLGEAVFAFLNGAGFASLRAAK